MKSIPHKHTILHIACAVISGFLLYFSGFPSPIAFLAILGPIPLVYVLLKEKPVIAFLSAWTTWFIGYFWVFFIYIKMIGIIFSLVFVLSIAVIFALFSLICVFLRKILHPLLWMIFYACGFVLIEWIAVQGGMGLHMITAHGPVSGVPWLLACSSTGGAYFVTFIIRLIPAATGIVMVEKKRYIRICTIAGVGILFILCAVYGTYYASVPDVSGQGRGYKKLVPPAIQRKIRVAAIVYEIPDNIQQFYENTGRFARSRGGLKSPAVGKDNPHQHKEYLQLMMEKYETLIRRAAADNAAIIAGPECSFLVPDFLTDYFTSRLVSLARECSATIIIGFWEHTTPANSILIALPDDRNFKIDKHTLVPIIESSIYVPGPEDPVIIYTDGIRFSVKICFELNFPGIFRTIAKQGADMLIAPFLDWWEITGLHAYETHYRGVENGMALLRPCRQGMSTIVDPYGNCIAKAIPDDEMTTYLVADLPLKEKSGTFYTYTGDWIVYLSMLVILACCIIAIGKKLFLPRS